MSSDPVFVHVGLPKTGTTDLQKVLWDNRRQLSGSGVEYPVRGRGTHYHAALDLIGSKRAPEPGAWEALAARARETPGRVVLSHEMLAAAKPKHVRRVLADLTSRDVHVIISVRDFSRIVSATWQERAKNREVEQWRPFLDEVAKGPTGGHAFWRLQDAPRVIETWARHLPADRIHVITVPPLSQDPQLLLRRFASVVGFGTEELVPSERPANQSIGALEIAVLQQVNLAAAQLSWDEYTRWVKNYLVKQVLSQRPDQLRVVLPEDTRGWVEAETARIAEAVSSSGCHLVGDLSELEPKGIGVRSERETDAPDAFAPTEVLSATSQVVVELVRETGRLRRKLRWIQPQDGSETPGDQSLLGKVHHVADRLRAKLNG